MEIVEIKVTDKNDRLIRYFLGRKYNKDKRTSLSKLCNIAFAISPRKMWRIINNAILI